MTHKIQVSFTEEQMRLLAKVKGIMGNTDAEVIRSITISWLSEKSFITSTAKKQRDEGAN